MCVSKFVLGLILPLSLGSTLRAQAPVAPTSPNAVESTSAAPTSPAASNPQTSEILLWPEGAPGALGDEAKDKPSLTAYLPEPAKRNGASMLVLPGGGYGHLAEHEGKGYAEWLVSNGIAAYVLKYRLGPAYHHPAMLQDVSRALRLVRSYAKRDGLDPARVGVMGSSAGGHLASTLLTHFDGGDPAAADEVERLSSRPDLGVLCYAVISLGEFAHAGSKKNLLGETPDPELVQDLSNETRVTVETPPCFIWHTVEDKTVPVENALMFAAALRKNEVPFSLHIYETGAHGLGLGRPGKPAPPWADQLLYWFHERKFLP
jgi:acetyl esterase/lipase